MMTELRLKSALAAAFFLSAGGAAQAETYELNAVSFRDFTGTVDIKTTSGDEVDIAIRQGKTYAPVILKEEDGVLVVTGEKWKEDDADDCCNRRITRTFKPREGRELTTGAPVDEGFFADYPTIEVLMPYEGDVEFIDARIRLAMERLAGALNLDACYVYGETGDLEEAAIGVVHGSRLVMGNVKGGLEIDVSGDADVRAGDAAMVDVDIAGPGDVVLGDIEGMLDVSIAGSGLVRAAHMDGPVTARIAGSGALAVKGGRADRLRAFIDGSGGVFFRGAAVQPDLTLYGSAEVHLDSAEGRIARHGGGTIYVGGVKLED
ncbi:hypothetical protein [Hyphococcus luteus]|uniref:Uncharacterized protein n=1 Tax=Hyphococcus luteus TaxID=2058213 RepID=A0A2S7K4Q0_9PROT|nr:hypothetical protein [Marinicaulis flavus]PQA87487.1 hypothetical protein CW354_11835 [Marinicaulis flavus]